jgi:RHS repeat-associated protein
VERPRRVEAALDRRFAVRPDEAVLRHAILLRDRDDGEVLSEVHRDAVLRRHDDSTGPVAVTVQPVDEHAGASAGEVPQFLETGLDDDPAGHLVYDGLYNYTYDAWNPLAKVYRAYKDEQNPPQLHVGSLVASMEYDGLGRRIVKKIENSGDWDGEFRYYYDAHRIVEVRDGDGRVLQQLLWGTQYVDELVQVALNQDPQDTDESSGGACERWFWALHDVNYNVIGVMNQTGLLVERYEYTPYGERKVFSRHWLLGDLDGDGVSNTYDMDIWYDALGTGDPNHVADLDGDGDVDEDDLDVLMGCVDGGIPEYLNSKVANRVFESSRGQGAGDLMPHPVSLCDFGHQGLLFDKEFGLYDNRGRMYHPRLMRFMQRDPLGYVDGGSLYQYARSTPANGIDPYGLLMIYAEGGVNLPGVMVADLKALSDEASKRFMEAAEHNHQAYHFAEHRDEGAGGLGGGWNNVEKIEANAENILKEILSTTDDTISIFAHSTASATVIAALEMLEVENGERRRKGEKPVRINVLIICAGTATRTPELKRVLRNTVDKTFIIRGGKDDVVEKAYILGNADQRGMTSDMLMVRPNLGQDYRRVSFGMGSAGEALWHCTLPRDPLGHGYGFYLESLGSLFPPELLTGSGTRDGMKWEITEECRDTWGHVTYFEKLYGHQFFIDSFIEQLGMKVPPLTAKQREEIDGALNAEAKTLKRAWGGYPRKSLPLPGEPQGKGMRLFPQQPWGPD